MRASRRKPQPVLKSHTDCLALLMLLKHVAHGLSSADEVGGKFLLATPAHDLGEFSQVLPRLDFGRENPRGIAGTRSLDIGEFFVLHRGVGQDVGVIGRHTLAFVCRHGVPQLDVPVEQRWDDDLALVVEFYVERARQAVDVRDGAELAVFDPPRS